MKNKHGIYDISISVSTLIETLIPKPLKAALFEYPKPLNHILRPKPSKHIHVAPRELEMVTEMVHPP